MPLEEGPWPLGKLLRVRKTVLWHLVRNGYLMEEPAFYLYEEGPLVRLEMRFMCFGHVRFEGKELWSVEKPLPRGDIEVMLHWYNYNAVLEGVGTIFRYNSPHPDHNQQHHVHRYDVLGGDAKGEVVFLHGAEERVSMAEAVEEAARWYFEHEDRLGQQEGGAGAT